MSKKSKDKPEFKASQKDFNALNNLQKHVIVTAKSKGWYKESSDFKHNLNEDFVHLMEELGELVMAYRKGKLNEPCDKTEKMLKLSGETLSCQEEEVADLLIKTLCISSLLKINIAKVVELKDAYNKVHGKIIP